MTGVVQQRALCPPTPALKIDQRHQYLSLWSGRWEGVADSKHCDLPLLSGFLPYRTPRGSCELRGSGPNLWFGVARALGFTISSVRLPPRPFVDLILDVCPHVSVLSVLPRRCNTLPDVVFLDLLSIPPVERLSGSYWRAWTTPHVFFFWAGDTDSSSLLGRGASSHVAPPSWLGRKVNYLVTLRVGRGHLRSMDNSGLVSTWGSRD